MRAVRMHLHRRGYRRPEPISPSTRRTRRWVPYSPEKNRVPTGRAEEVGKGPDHRAHARHLRESHPNCVPGPLAVPADINLIADQWVVESKMLRLSMTCAGVKSIPLEYEVTDRSRPGALQDCRMKPRSTHGSPRRTGRPRRATAGTDSTAHLTWIRGLSQPTKPPPGGKSSCSVCARSRSHPVSTPAARSVPGRSRYSVPVCSWSPRHVSSSSHVYA